MDPQLPLANQVNRVYSRRSPFSDGRRYALHDASRGKCFAGCRAGALPEGKYPAPSVRFLLPGLSQVRKSLPLAIEANQIGIEVTKEESLAVVRRLMRVRQIDRLGKCDRHRVEGRSRVGGNTTTVGGSGVGWSPGLRGTAGQREQKDGAGSGA
jgi:hypothetical protein